MLSASGLRYAIEKLPSALKSELLAKYKQPTKASRSKSEKKAAGGASEEAKLSKCQSSAVTDELKLVVVPRKKRKLPLIEHDETNAREVDDLVGSERQKDSQHTKPGTRRSSRLKLSKQI
jgi:hypothetical protein